MEVSEVLNKAADLLEKPGAWTQGAIGRLEDGTPVLSADATELSRATCYCMAGALWVANGYQYPGAAFDALPEGPRRGTGTWNDATERTQAEVVEVLRQAALRAAATQEAGQ